MEGKYFEVPGVAIFDEHEDPSKDGFLRKVDRQLLEEIAEKCQKRIQDTGDKSPIVLGHTSKENPNRPVVGFAKNFRVGTIGKENPRAAIVADFELREDMKDEIRKFPRRSIEIWPDKVIDPIALLGSETPRRDLGLLQYSRRDDAQQYSRDAEPVRYEMDKPKDESMSYDVNEITSKVMQAFMETPVGKWIEGKMAVEQQADEAEQIAQETESGDGDPFRDNEEVMDGPEAPLPADNTDDIQVPGDEPDGDEPPPVDDEEPQKMSRAQAELYSRIATLEKKAHEAEKRAELAERKQVLAGLYSKGYVLNVNEELDDTKNFTAEQFSRHVKKITARYTRAPIGVNIVTSDISDGGEQGPVTFGREDAEKAQQYMREKKVSYSVARDMVLAEKVKG